MPKVRVTFWVTAECRDLLILSAALVGMPQGAYIEQAVRSLASGSTSSRIRTSRPPAKRSP